VAVSFWVMLGAVSANYVCGSPGYGKRSPEKLGISPNKRGYLIMVGHPGLMPPNKFPSPPLHHTCAVSSRRGLELSMSAMWAQPCTDYPHQKHDAPQTCLHFQAVMKTEPPLSGCPGPMVTNAIRTKATKQKKAKHLGVLQTW
jgi:hypothetical protein